MTTSEGNPTLEEQIDEWRSYLRSRQAIHSADVAELEDHLREVIDDLVDAGLATDEAFLVAVKRMGKLDALSREFAREHSERLWKQLVVAPTDADESRTRVRIDAVVAFCLAVAAAVLIKMPALFRIQIDEDISFYARNFSLFVLPLLTGYFAWKRQLDASNTRWLAGWSVCRSSCTCKRVSVRSRRTHGSARCTAPADSTLGGSGHRIRRRQMERGSGTYGFHPILRGGLYLLRAYRPRRWRPDRYHGDDLFRDWS
jgi:hypothetical protein